ncbi:hypothetical protein OsI_04085 [Oryza sativa Indica Group]|uniref:Uncharacterized protein n=2 Tax=Oryza TaxID=4527 RepID=B8AAV7_ORYSI|nr:hypothetical protein OsI_04085 [Oryza sativa Indica Group]
MSSIFIGAPDRLLHTPEVPVGENHIILSSVPIEAMSTSSLHAFVVFFVVQVCLLVVMASSSSWTVQGRPLALESVPACCFYHPDCCQAAGADPAIADP